MGLVQEFKEFAVKGNALDLAVGVIIGAAFGKIVASLVDDVLMPPIGKLLGGVDMHNLFFALGSQQYATLDEAKKAGVATINYGNFLQSVIDFLIVAFVVFVMVKAINRRRHAEAVPPPAVAETPEEVVLLREIRDSLKTSPVRQPERTAAP
jgi:large conductance mechanosensitive channel